MDSCWFHLVVCYFHVTCYYHMYRHMHLYYDSLVMVIIYHRVHFRAMEMLVMDMVCVV